MDNGSYEYKMIIKKSSKNIIIKTVLVVIAIVLSLVFAGIYIWRNTYQFHAIMLSDEHWYAILNVVEDGPWVCQKEKIRFSTIDDLNGEGSLTSVDGRSVDFHIDFDYSPSLYLTFDIEGNKYEAMGYINDEHDIYTVIFNDKNWPDEYFGDENRELVFTLET